MNKTFSKSSRCSSDKRKKSLISELEFKSNEYSCNRKKLKSALKNIQDAQIPRIDLFSIFPDKAPMAFEARFFIIFYVFLIPSMRTWAICLDELKSLVEGNSQYQFIGFTEDKNALGEHVLKILGQLNEQDKVKSLASLEYNIVDDQIDIGMMFTHQSLRGYGIQKKLFRELLDRNPDIRQINTTLVDSNELILMRHLVENLIRDDLPVKTFNPMDSIEKQFEQCCGDLFDSFTPEEKMSHVEKALEHTPAVKIRREMGLKPCEENAVEINRNRRGGEYSLVIYLSYCR